MTVEAIRLQNFMAFEDTASQDSNWIELRPICLLFGRNSSGKSVIIRALRLLKQSLNNSPNDGPLAFVKEDEIDQGSFWETVHNQEVDRLMTFHFRCRVVETLDALKEYVNRRRARDEQPLIPVDTSQEWVELSLTFGRVEEDKQDEQEDGVEEIEKVEQVELTQVRIDCPWPAIEGQNDRMLFEATKLDKEIAITLGEDWWVESNFLYGHESDTEGSPWSGVSIELTSGFLPTLAGRKPDPQKYPASAEDFELIDDLLHELRQSVETFLRTINYIGPIRPEPQRVYTFDKLAQLRWERRGWSAYLNFLSGKVDHVQLLEVDKWLRHLDLGDEVEAGKYIEDLTLEFAVRIGESSESGPFNLRDVGFGTAQVLPIIIQCLMADENSLIIIEQPELHLHPRAQAQLGDLFIRIAQGGRRFLIETHSEHLLLRIRRRVAETTAKMISPNDSRSLGSKDLKVYFVDRVEGRSFTRSIEIDRLGSIIDPPERFKGFFSDDTRDVFELTKAALQAEAL